MIDCPFSYTFETSPSISAYIFVSFTLSIASLKRYLGLKNLVSRVLTASLALSSSIWEILPASTTFPFSLNSIHWMLSLSGHWLEKSCLGNTGLVKAHQPHERSPGLYLLPSTYSLLMDSEDFALTY